MIKLPRSREETSAFIASPAVPLSRAKFYVRVGTLRPLFFGCPLLSVRVRYHPIGLRQAGGAQPVAEFDRSLQGEIRFAEVERVLLGLADD